MCGIAGFIDTSGFDSTDDLQVAHKMCALLKHRGPDDSGVWSDRFENRGISLAHTRLAIQDVSVAGHQPMVSRSGRFVIAFNGEIYNHLTIRRNLQRTNWNGRSDTETLLESFEQEGVAKTLTKLQGMFAFVVWDRRARLLHLARDKVGEKPLYFGWSNKVFFFGSELTALKAHQQFSQDISRESVALLMRFGYVPHPNSIYEGIFKLTPGSSLTISGTVSQGHIPQPESYWSLGSVEADRGTSCDYDDSQIVESYHQLLRRIVEDQMLSDVPVGAFISGGIDSSTIVALMQDQSDRPIDTFTIGFDDQEFNEAEYARSIADHLGTNHHEKVVSENDLLEIVPMLSRTYDEPFADASQIPTRVLCNYASRFVKVALTGDGGDELFGGYQRYQRAERMWNRLSSIPLQIRKALATVAGTANYGTGSTLDKIRLGLRRNATVSFVHKTDLLKAALACENGVDYYVEAISRWRRPGELVVGYDDVLSSMPGRNDWPKIDEYRKAMMFADFHTYLPDDILVKVDRAAMSVSLETRLPLLDPRLIEMSWKLPSEQRGRDGQSKWILRQILSKYVPIELFDRPKKGFSVPMASWLRGPLRDWAEELLDPKRLESEGYFDADLVSVRWRDHLAGVANWQNLIWPVLMFQSWKEDN